MDSLQFLAVVPELGLWIVCLAFVMAASEKLQGLVFLYFVQYITSYAGIVLDSKHLFLGAGDLSRSIIISTAC